MVVDYHLVAVQRQWQNNIENERTSNMTEAAFGGIAKSQNFHHLLLSVIDVSYLTVKTLLGWCVKNKT